MICEQGSGRKYFLSLVITRSFRKVFAFFCLAASILCFENIVYADESGLFGMPDAKYEVDIERHVTIVMRDGVGLVMDIYRPIGINGRLPVILIRTPYNRKSLRKGSIWDGKMPSPARFFAGQGFIVAVQDVRGRFDSEGTYTVSGGDVYDGYDTVEWLAVQSWSSGKIGSYGCSYFGESQVLMAQSKPPHLTTMVPQAAGGAIGSADGRYRYFASRVGGAVALATTSGWFNQWGNKVFLRYPEGIGREVLLKMDALSNTFPGGKYPEGDYANALNILPLTSIPKYLNSLPSDFVDVITRDVTDPWWNQLKYISDDSTFNTPALHVNSWYDYGVNETILQWKIFREKSQSKIAGNNQFMIISPATHCLSEILADGDSTIVGERNMGNTQFPYWDTYLKWFNYWLKGEQNEVTEIPKVQYFMMGENEWRSSETWPPKNVEFQKFYLHSDGNANSRQGDGVLSRKIPEQEPPDRFTYDPATPVPSRGGSLCCTGSPGDVPGSFDQSNIEMRNDILVYTTSELQEKVQVAGPIELVLYVSSSSKDTDFVGKLIDVFPDGRAFNIQEGIIRARYREGFDKQVFMKEGEVYEIKISLNATAITFLPGHKIRLWVTSSNFPTWDRNLNTGGTNYSETQWVKANNTVHHSGIYASHLVLTVLR